MLSYPDSFARWYVKDLLVVIDIRKFTFFGININPIILLQPLLLIKLANMAVNNWPSPCTPLFSSSIVLLWKCYIASIIQVKHQLLTSAIKTTSSFSLSIATSGTPCEGISITHVVTLWLDVVLLFWLKFTACHCCSWMANCKSIDKKYTKEITYTSLRSL